MSTDGNMVRQSAGSHDPLAATPVIAPGVETYRDGTSVTHLRRVRTTNGAVRFLAQLLGLKNYTRFVLDERGSAYWEQVDGCRNLHTIERHLRERFGLTREDSERAVVEFTKMLMLRGLLCLRITEQDERQSG